MSQDLKFGVLWKTAEMYLSAGFSIVPVNLSNKRPSLRSWKEYQSRLIEKDVLFSALSDSQNPALAVICGRVSGNLECIDVDIKHNPEGAEFLREVKSLYPELTSRLRLHKTQSGGFHIFYRIEGGVPDGNQKLAVAKGQKEAWLETRGEGGYALIPPSAGYEQLTVGEIPIITLAERDEIIGLAKSFDTRGEPLRKEKKLSKSFKSHYSVNPWDDFAASPEAEGILLRHGWKECPGGGNNYMYFTRPGKERGVSASFNLKTRIYYIFTSSSGLEPNRGYTPGTLACILEHGGDTSACHRWLVESGYGRLDPRAEKAIIQESVRRGIDAPPPNLSPEAARQFELAKGEFDRRYPFGIFWDGDLQEGFTINAHLILVVAEKLGFRWHKGDICDISDPPFIRRVDSRHFFDRIKDYIREDTAEVAISLYAALEKFYKTYGDYIISRIPELDESKIMRSERRVCRKPFRNGVVEVTGDSAIRCIPYNAVINSGNLIWWEDVIERDYRPSAGVDGIFCDFIDKATVLGSGNMPVIGYLCHEYKDATMSYIISLMEEAEDPKDGGGVGKNVLTKMIGQFTTLGEAAGEQVQFDDRFFQPWNGQRVYAISDLPERFKWEFLKNPASNGATVKRLWKNIYTVGENELPKLLVSTNYSYTGKDGGLRRRIIPVEFTDYFKREGGVDEVYNKLFPADFDDEDWATFDNYILLSIKKFLASPKLKHPELTETGWVKQFRQTYSRHIYDFVSANIDRFVNLGFVDSDFFTATYDNYCVAEGVGVKYRVSRQRMNDALQDYCDKHGIAFERRASTRVNGVTRRGVRFGDNNNEDEEVPF